MILSVNLLVKILYSFVNVNFDGSVLFYFFGFVCWLFFEPKAYSTRSIIDCLIFPYLYFVTCLGVPI